MSVTICWRPAADDGTAFKNNGTSTDLDNIHRVFGTVIGKDRIAELRAIAAVGNRNPNLFEEIANTIEQIDGAIVVFGSY